MDYRNNCLGIKKGNLCIKEKPKVYQINENGVVINAEKLINYFSEFKKTTK